MFLYVDGTRFEVTGVAAPHDRLWEFRVEQPHLAEEIRRRADASGGRLTVGRAQGLLIGFESREDPGPITAYWRPT